MKEYTLRNHNGVILYKGTNPVQAAKEKREYEYHMQTKVTVESVYIPDYQAVTKDQLIELLGKECSPTNKHNGYLVGYDLNGRLCHTHTMITLVEAQQKADQLNKEGL